MRQRAGGQAAVSAGVGSPVTDGDARCLSALSEHGWKGGLAHADMRLWADKQMKPGSRLFAVGDSVVGELLSLGRPGFSCSEVRQCRGTPPFAVGGNLSWQLELDKADSRYIGKGWQHLRRYMLRSANDEISQVEGWQVSPGVERITSGPSKAVALLQQFLRDDVKATANDVMVIGMLGSHFNNHEMTIFERYAELLLKDVVTSFPGRVVVLGTSPQHFHSATGAYDTSKTHLGCRPIPSPSAAGGGNNKYRNSIWGYKVWQYQWSWHRRVRFVDMYEMLHPLWQCHRVHHNRTDCTHWADPVISLQIQLILEALQLTSPPSPARKTGEPAGTGLA